MPNSVNIKTAGPKNAKSIMQFLQILNQESDTVIIDPNLSRLTVKQECKQIRLINHTLDNVIIIATLNDRCIGIVTVRRCNHYSGELGVAVAKQYRHHGLGKILVQEAIRWLRSFSNLQFLVLVVKVTNRIALRLYQDCGFKTVSKQKIEDVRQNLVSVIKMMIN